ncbi:MAG: ABC transporter ATP-binding protein [Actinobacteria bacterium]|nr:ABC transporter ATP-binding protein [Actinomycetota bacterium]
MSLGGGGETGIDVEFRHVTRRFGSLTAIDAVDLHVRKGEFLCLLGPASCGKTTSLRLMAGFEQPDEGVVLLGGRDARDIPPYARAVTTTLLRPGLFPHMTVLDNVEYVLRQRRLPRAERHARAREALELVHLPGFEDCRPSVLTDRQRQRVSLARALALHPRVLLLDEPFEGLHRRLRAELQVELRSIQEQLGMTLVTALRDPEDALSTGDRVAVMSGGRVEQLDEPGVVYDHPRTAFVAEYVGETNFLTAEVTEAGHGRLVAKVGEDLVVRALDDGARVGDEITIGIRSGRMVASRDRTARAACAAAGVNCALAEVVSRTYLDDSIQIVARLARGPHVVVRERRAVAEPELHSVVPGDTITVSWDESAPHVCGRSRDTAA